MVFFRMWFALVASLLAVVLVAVHVPAAPLPLVTWKHDGTTIASYGTKGVPNASNRPGGRRSFQGRQHPLDPALYYAYGGTNTTGLSDLWRYNTTNNEWAWLHGSVGNVNGVYGTRGVPNAANTPGARFQYGAWFDASRNYWLFAGLGRGETGGGSNFMNDLWKFDTANVVWTWMNGNKTNLLVLGTYPSQIGVPNADASPSGRYSPAVAAGSTTAYIFGGYSPGALGGAPSFMNDFWSVDLLSGVWTWIGGNSSSGANSPAHLGRFGVQGVAGASNWPGARHSGVMVHRNGVLYMFGGQGLANNTVARTLADLWSYNTVTKQWTWLTGYNSNVGGEWGLYGPYGVFGAFGPIGGAGVYTPGARLSFDMTVDGSGNLWLYGGAGCDRSACGGLYLNDLWQYSPVTRAWAFMHGNSTGNDAGNIGVLNVPSVDNRLPARAYHQMTFDNRSRLWVFGGDSSVGAPPFDDIFSIQTVFDVCLTTPMPCANNGTCSSVFGAANYTCSCTSAWSGPTCTADANECQINNGGCGYSPCLNDFGGFHCTPAFVPVQFTSPTAVYSADPFVLLNTLGGQDVRFYISHPHAIYAIGELRVALIPPPNSNLPTPSNSYYLTSLAPVNPLSQLVQITVGPGFGAGYTLALYYATLTLAMSNYTISYPPPVLTPNSIRRLDDGYPQDPLPVVEIDTTGTAKVGFDGNHFWPSATTVTYGSGVYTATVLDAMTTFLQLGTVPGSSGLFLHFTVTVGNQLVNSTGKFLISFPTTSTVRAVAGCKDVGATTTECRTSGGQRIYLYGSEFIQTGTSVTVGGGVCTSPIVYNTTVMSCLTPRGAGGSLKSVVVLNNVASVAVFLLQYSDPIVSGITGCPRNGSALATTDCATTGGDVVTVYGANFGLGAIVLVGGSIVSSVNQSDSDADSRLTFVTESGSGVDKPVVVLQRGGSIGASNLLLSYKRCAAGTRASGIQCVPCTSGTVSRDENAASCDSCEPGKYSGEAPSMECSPCPVGRYSGFGASACSNCTAGSFGSSPNQAACNNLCPLGRYSNSSGLSVCYDCRAGTAQPQAGQTACVTCDPGSFSAETNPAQTLRFNTVCQLCPPGTYSAVNGSTGCMACSAGTATGNAATAAAAGATACVECSGGTRYQEQSGQALCLFCPATFYNRIVPTSSGDTTRRCEACEIGSQCTELGGIQAEADYFVYLDNGLLVTQPCQPQFCAASTSAAAAAGSESCEEQNAAALRALNAGSNDPNGTISSGSGSGYGFDNSLNRVFSCCESGRKPASINPLCGACEDGRYNWGGQCIECSEANAPYIVLFIGLTWGYVTLFHYLAQDSKADMQILLNFAQFVFLFLSSQSGNITSFLAIFNANVFASSGGTTCIAPLTDLERLSTGLFVPLLGFGFLALNCGLHAFRWWLASTNRCGCCDSACITSDVSGDSFWPHLRNYRRTALGFMSSSYPSVAQCVFSFLSCIPVKSDRFIALYPSISCENDAEYRRVYPLFVTLLVLVVALPLLVAGRLYHLNRSGRLYGDSDITYVYGIWHSVYKPKLFVWESFVLIRRLVIAAIVLAPQFNADSSARFTYLCLCCVLFSWVHFFFNPYRQSSDNNAQSAGELTLVVLALFLTTAPNPLTPVYAIGLSAMCFAVGAVFVVRVVIHRFDKAKAIMNRITDCFASNCPIACVEWCRQLDRRDTAGSRKSAASSDRAPSRTVALAITPAAAASSSPALDAPVRATPPSASAAEAAPANSVSVTATTAAAAAAAAESVSPTAAAVASDDPFAAAATVAAGELAPPPPPPTAVSADGDGDADASGTASIELQRV